MAEIKIPSDKDGFYHAGRTLYYFWLHYLSIKQESDDSTFYSVTYTLRYGIDEPSNIFSVNRKTYDPDSYAVAYDELTELGAREINALLNFLDATTSDVKLITEDSKGQQEVGVVSRNPDKTSVVLSAYGSEQQFDDSILKNLVYLDSSSVASGSSTDWTTFGTVSLTVNHVQSEQGLLIPKGSYVKSKELQLGDKSFTIEFYSYVDESSSDNSCICEVAHADHDIKVKFLKKINEATGETVTTAGFYLDDILVTCSKPDIMISNTLNHFAVVYQNSGKVLFFFVNGILVGNTDCSLTENIAIVYFNYDTTTEEKTFTGTIDMVRITGELARWIPDEDKEDDANLTFYPPQVFIVKERTIMPAKKLMNFYLPFERHFDDSKFLVISKKPVQTDRPTYDGVTTFEPVWNYYDPDQLKMEGDSRSKEAGVHYVTFTPWNDHVWRDGTTKAKISIWIVDRKKISTYPEQEEILAYNGAEQDINLKNYDDDIMTLSGTVKATDANSSDNPYYIAYVTPKDGFVWLTGRNDPYEVRWQIK